MTDIFETTEAPATGHNAIDKNLKTYLDRLQRLDEEIATLNEDKKEVLAEAKRKGLSPKTIRAVYSFSKKAPEERAEFRQYGESVGLWDGLDV